MPACRHPCPGHCLVLVRTLVAANRLSASGVARVDARVRAPQVEFDLGEDRLQRHEDAAAHRRAALQLKRSIAASRSSRFSVGGCTTAAVPANETMPMRTLLRLVVDERARRFLRGRQPVGLHVDGAHAARDVHREDDRFVLRRQRDDRGRPRNRDDHQRECARGTAAAECDGGSGCPRPSRPSPSARLA